MSDDELPPLPSPLPLFGGHLLGMGLHLSGGVTVALTLLLGPAWVPIMDVALTPTRIWLAGIAGFSTLVTLFFSTVATVVCYRLITAFLVGRSAGVVRALMVVGVLVAHIFGCATGVVGSGVAVFGTVMGEHGGPWSEPRTNGR